MIGLLTHRKHVHIYTELHPQHGIKVRFRRELRTLKKLSPAVAMLSYSIGWGHFEAADLPRTPSTARSGAGLLKDSK